MNEQAESETTLGDVLSEMREMNKAIKGINRVVNIIGVLMLLGAIVTGCNALLSL